MSDNAIVPKDAPPLAAEGMHLSIPALSWEQKVQLAKAAVASGLFKDLDSTAQALIKIKYGEECGLLPAQALKNVFVVNGTPSFSAGFLAAQVKASRPRYNYRIREHSTQKCKLEFFEDGESAGFSEYTMEDAARAGVAKKDVWVKYPKGLLFARAVSQGVRWYAPDLLNGAPAYTPEELGGSLAAEDVEVEVISTPERNANAG